jgi:signal transduction histidine kinase
MTDLKFTVDSALLSELGEKLVETVHLALAELVKNAYDADATLVEIRFSRDQKGQMQIVISDDGIGMNFEVIKNYWMRIATTNKANQRVSKVFGRPLSGAKGIGRFSCRRLGSHLRIVTKGTKKGNIRGKQATIEKTDVQFPWLDFTAGEDITTIKCPGKQELVKNDQTGTTLIITGVSESEWTNRGYNWLKRQLAVLVANRGSKRKGFEEDPGFNVNIFAPDFEGKQLEDVRDKLLKAGWGTLRAYVDKKGYAVCNLEALGIQKRQIISSEPFPLLRDVSLELAIMVDDKEQIRDSKILSLGTLRNITGDWGGIQIRYKGVRVYPYGDDDWLNIDRDRGLRKLNPNNDQLFSFAQTLKGVTAGRSLINMLSMNGYVGSVDIGESAKGFEPKLSREGFVSSPAFEELIKFVRFAVDWSTILRDYYIRQEYLKTADRAKEKFEEVINEKIEAGKIVESAIALLRTETKVISDTLPTGQKKKFADVFESATEVILKQHEAAQVELTHLRLIASTSTLLLIFSHEVKSLLGVLEESKNALKVLAPKLQPNQKTIVEEITVEFTDLKNRLAELLNMTALVGSGSRRSKAGQVSLLDRVKKVETVFELITKKYDIAIDYSRIPNNIAFRKIYEAEVYSILLNIISNSIKSVIAEGGSKKIELSAERENGMNVIIIRDTGIGLDSSLYEEVFVPFISDPESKLYSNLEKRINPEDNMIVGSGSGLGLSIVKEIVVAYGGTIKFKKPSKNWNSELEIKLP